MSMLEVENISTYYGQIRALKDVSITVNKGEIVTIIGANGAGKSTMLKTTSGLLKPRRGRITLAGDDLTGLKAHEIVMKGVVQVPEGRRVFGRLTVRENLEMGAFTSRDNHKNQENLQRVFTMFPRLKERSKQVSGTLSGGEQQMLAMGRALMANPLVLLLDEPSMGLAPVLVDGIFDTIRHAARRRDHDPAGGAKRPHGASGRQPGLRPAVGLDHRQRHGRQPGRQPDGPQGLPGRALTADAPWAASRRSRRRFVFCRHPAPLIHQTPCPPGAPHGPGTR